MQKNVHLNYRKDIDGLRAIAVLSVIGFHAFPRWVPGGFVGVDIFFVISGYLISSILFQTLNKGYFSFIDFYQRRIKRIFPALMITLIACYVVGWFALLGTDFKSIGKHLAYGSGFLSNFILLGESGYFSTATEFKPFLHLWSLGIEEQFYALWPALVVLTYRNKTLFLSFITLIIALSFGASVAALAHDPSGAFYLPHYRAWELLIGALLAYLSINTINLPTLFTTAMADNIKAACGLILLVVSVFLFNKTMPFPGWRVLLPTIGTLLLISSGKDSWLNRHICSHSALVFFGLISFPLYLWHWPVLVFLKISTHAALTPMQTWLAVLTCIALAYVTYRFVELPIKKTSRLMAAWLLIIAFIVAGLGYWTYQNDGLTFRFPKAVQYLSDADYVQQNRVTVEKSYRQDKCFLLAADDRPFSEECTDPDFKNTTHSLFLWGDSHAAMLYNGLMSVKKTHPFAFAQYTVASCGPLLKPRTEYFCKARTEFIKHKIMELKPDTIILGARWETFQLPDIPETITFLKNAGVNNIIVVGMVPIWSDPAGLPAVLVNAFNHNVPHAIPERVVMENIQYYIDIDNNVKNIVENSGATYISAVNALCDESGCLATQGKELMDLTTLDYGHLTPKGSAYLMEKTLVPILDSTWKTTSP